MTTDADRTRELMDDSPPEEPEPRTVQDIPRWTVAAEAERIRRFLAPLIRHVRIITEADAAVPCERFATERRRATARLDAIRRELREAIDSNETDEGDDE